VIKIITFNLDELLKELKISRNRFSVCSGIRPNTINDMCNGITKRIEINTLNSILICLNNMSDRSISIEDLIAFNNEEVDRVAKK
jgi:DNA-binding Xre family transcriptional regulator